MPNGNPFYGVQKQVEVEHRRGHVFTSASPVTCDCDDSYEMTYTLPAICSRKFVTNDSS